MTNVSASTEIWRAAAYETDWHWMKLEFEIKIAKMLEIWMHEEPEPVSILLERAEKLATERNWREENKNPTLV